jgi:tellurite resistance protein TehA-like permease
MRYIYYLFAICFPITCYWIGGGELIRSKEFSDVFMLTYFVFVCILIIDWLIRIHINKMKCIKAPNDSKIDDKG